MFRKLANLFSFATNALFAALIVGVALPGTHRMIAPGAFGMTEIAPAIWTDAPGRARSLLAVTEAARAEVTAFFGEEPRRPITILCSTRRCARQFGIRGNGLSIGYLAVMVSPGGLTQGTLTHEFTHSRLHRSMGLRNIIRQPYPTWFDEGLATHVADHPGGGIQITAADRRRVRQVERFWNWDNAYREMGVRRAYRAAAAEVAAIEARAGRRGLLELIDRAEAGEDFDAVLREILSR